MTVRYPVVIHKDPDSDYGVTVPDLPGCFSAGETMDEALDQVVEAIKLHIESMLLDGEPIPAPHAVEHHKDNPDYADGVWALVSVDITKLSEHRDNCDGFREVRHVQRKMSDPAFQQDQLDRRFDAHIAPVNRLVDALRRERGEQIPYVAPLYGGIDAEVLFIFQDPGPGTDGSARGSGFLCSQNDDPTAEIFADCLDACGLDVRRTLSWNAYPWQLAKDQKRPKASQLEAGVEPTRRLLELLPRLKAIVLMGRVAQNGWRRYGRRHPNMANRYVVVESPHPSRRGLVGGGMTRDEGITEVKRAIRTACESVA